jgi:hypothetical protein
VSILITAATSAQAHKLKNKLGNPEVVLGDYADLPDFMVKSMELLKLPNPASVSYQHEMLTLCLDRGIDTVYVLTGLELSLLHESELLFKEYNIDILDGQVEI